MTRLNHWYDNLPGTPRFLFFLGMMSLAIFPLRIGLSVGNMASTMFGTSVLAVMVFWGIHRAFSHNGFIHTLLAALMAFGFFFVALKAFLSFS